MPATRDELFARFKALGLETTTRDHAPVFTVEEAQALRGEIPGGHCKNLVLKDDKVVSEEPLLVDMNVRVRDVRVAPDGAVWVLEDGKRMIRITAQ